MQTETGRRQDESAFLRDLLHLLTSSESTEAGISALLQAAQSYTGAIGSCFRLLHKPNTDVRLGAATRWSASTAALRESVTVLVDGIYLNPKPLAKSRKRFPAIVAIPIVLHGSLVGGLWLIFDQTYSVDGTTQASLLALADAFRVLAERLLTEPYTTGSSGLALAVLDGVSDPIIVMDAEHKVTTLNAAAQDIFGVTPTEAAGQPFRDIVKSENLTALVEKGAVVAEWVGPDERIFVPKFRPIHQVKAVSRGYFLLLQDVTHYKRLNHNQSEFMHIVSHDLRSPITSIYGFASMLESNNTGELNPKQRHFVERILSGIGTISSLIDNIQDAGRYDPETGFYELTRSKVNLVEIVQRIAANLIVPADKQDLSIKVKVGKNLPTLYADANMLERAIANLVDNAVKYTPNGGSVEIGLRAKQNQMVVSVRDTGAGISPENQKLLFQRHVRLARTDQKRIKGSGLGLFIVRSIARHHGGDAWVESREGQGSTFYIQIPLEGDNVTAP